MIETFTYIAKWLLIIGLVLNITMYIFFYTKRYKKPDFWKGAKPTLLKWIIGTIFLLIIIFVLENVI